MNSTSRYLKIFLILSILLNFGLGYKYLQTKFIYNPDHTYNRKELFEHLQVDSNSIVFIGNSLTQQFELAELFKNSNIRNRGINGDNATGVLNRLASIIQSRPKKIFIEIGINDILQGTTKEILLDNYKKILEKLQQGSGTSKIYVQSVLPVNKKGQAIVNSPVKNESIQGFNKDLQEYCAAHDITFINLYDKFELNGGMNPSLCLADGLHISGEGYLLWAKLLQPYIAE